VFLQSDQAKAIFTRYGFSVINWGFFVGPMNNPCILSA
jgi:hypothetical protein